MMRGVPCGWVGLEGGGPYLAQKDIVLQGFLGIRPLATDAASGILPGVPHARVEKG